MPGPRICHPEVLVGDAAESSPSAGGISSAGDNYYSIANSSISAGGSASDPVGHNSRYLGSGLTNTLRPSSLHFSTPSSATSEMSLESSSDERDKSSRSVA
eukprot:10543878-Karenia_brevis.AAC.1